MNKFDEGNEHPPVVHDYNKLLARVTVSQSCLTAVRTLMCYPLSHFHSLRLSTKSKEVSLDDMFAIIAV